MHIGQTERMLIRTLSLEDTAELTAILGDPEVMKYSVRGVCDEAMTRQFINWCLSCYASHGIGPWALLDKTSQALIGFCGIGPEQVDGVEEISLGYRLGRTYWGAGLATEAVRGVLVYAFDAKAIPSVIVIIEAHHIASRRVAEKAGFREFHDTRFHEKPVRVYRLAVEQWRVLETGQPKAPSR